MNVWVVGDIHFGVHINSTKWLEIQKKYFLDFLIPYLSKHATPNDVMVIMGDIFENRKFIDVNIFNETISIIKKLSEVMPIRIILGNHDIYYTDTPDVNSVLILKDVSEYKNIKVYVNPTIDDLGGMKCLFMPWITDIKKLEESILENPAYCIFAHMDITGVTYDNSRLVTGGVGVDALKSFKHVISGHIHWRQQKGNILYVGTPYQLNRGDMGNRKGIHKLVVENSEIKKIEFIQNKVSPEFKKVNGFDLMEMHLTQVKEIFDNNFVDIEWESDYAKKFSFKKVLDFLKKYDINPQKVEFPPYSIESRKDEIPVDIPDRFDLGDVFESYFKYKGYKKKEIEDTVNYFKELNKRYIENEKIRTS